MSISRGFEASYNVVSKALKGRAERQLQERLAQEQAKYGITENQAYTPEQIQGAQAETDAMARRDAQEFGLSAPMQYRAAAAPRTTPGQVQAAQSETAAMAQRDAQEFGLGAPMQYRSAARGFLVGDKAFDTREEAEAAAKLMRTQGLANVYRQAGKIEEADQAEARAMQMEAAGLTLKKGRREEKQVVDFDTGYAEINKQKFDKPEDRTAAILGLVESTQGVEARLRLENQYSQSELNKLTLQAKKFEDGFSQARTKGVFSAMEWFDEQNASFKLERDPKNPYRVIQVNQDGSRTLFADAKSERELGMIVDAKAKPGGWLELAKFDLDTKKANAAIAASNAQAKALRTGTPQYFEGDDGQMYATVPVSDRNGNVTFKTEPVNPSGVGLKRPGSGGDGKPVAVKEEGEKVLVNGRLMLTDGRGGYIAENAVLPSQRTDVLIKAGIPENMVDQIQWNKSGNAVGFGGKMYDPKDPKDMRELKADYVRLGENTIAVNEAQLNTPGSRVSRGFGPRLTYLPSEDSPSIYASPEQRAAFMQQRQQELLRQQQNQELAARMRGLYLGGAGAVE